MKPPDQNDDTWAERFLWLPPVLLAAWRFHSITQNYFYGDDLFNLHEIVNRSVVEYLFKPYGMHLLAARNLVYYLCARLFGTNAEPYFWLVLVTHVVNVLLLFRILRRLSGPRLACVAATVWGMSPVNEGALGWYSVYGQVMAATFILCVLDRLVYVTQGAVPAAIEPLLWGGLLLAAAVSFGTGIGAAMAFPVVAFVLLPPSPTRRRALLVFVAIACTLPLLYAAAHRLAEFYNAPSTGVPGGGFGGFRVVPIIALTGRLAAYGVTSLLLGPFDYPIPYDSVAYDIVPSAVAIALVAALVVGSSAVRRWVLAMLVLGGACYGIIAVGRLPFFTLFGKGVVTSARYHYAAPIPFAIAIVLAVGTCARWAAIPERWRNAALAVALVVTAGANALGAQPVDHHTRERTLAMRAVQKIRDQINAAPVGTDVYIKNERFNGVGPLMLQRPDLFPGLAGIFAVYFPEQVVDGRRVFFVIWDPQTLAAAQRGHKSSAFVVAPNPQSQGAAPPNPAPAAGASP